MSWFSKLRNVFRPHPLDRDLADEQRDHLERRCAALIEQGLTPEEAYRQASLMFGNVTAFREQSREARLWPAVETTLQDVVYAWRGLRNSPAFAVTVVLSLSLAIGANTAIYSIVNAAILRPLPVPDPQSLVALAVPDAAEATQRDAFSYPLFTRLRAASAGVAHLALFGPADRGELLGPEPNAPIERAVQQYISGEAFGILGVPPILGRVFSPEDDRVPGAAPFAILSNNYWRRRFGANPAILGQTLVTNNRAFTIVGVAAPAFLGIEPGRFVDIWLPLAQFDPGVFTNPGAGLFRIMGRLTPGAVRQQLQARLQPVFHLHQQEMIRLNPAFSPLVRQQMMEMVIRVNPGAAGASAFRRNFGRPLWIILGVAAGILLIACANVASLLSARSAARSAEMALRISLGAGRLRIVRQLLTESLLFSLLAGIGGWLMALWAAPALVSLLSKDSDPLQLDLAMDTRMLFFCAGVSTLAAAFFGLLPAWHAAGTKPIRSLYGASGEVGRLRLGRLFVGIQVAFAFCLVVVGIGFLFSLRNLVAVDTGFDPRGVTVLGVVNNPGPNRNALTSMQQLQLHIATLPNVQSASAAWWAIFDGSKRTDQVIVPGKPPADRQEIFYRVSSGYFKTLRTPLLHGRDLDFRDNDAADPVPSVVNLAFARKYFGGDDVIGKQFQRDDGVRHRIVGVAANALCGDLRMGTQPVVYFPMKPPRRFTLYVRSNLDPASLARLVEREGTTLGLGTRVAEVTTLETLLGNSILRERLLAGIGGVFAFLGIVLAAIGLFGLLNYSVLRRTKEIGVRAALGARPHELLLLVFKDLTGMMSAGLLAGAATSLFVLSLVRSMLFGIRPADPRVIATAAAVFLFSALIAAGLPARRAVAIDPMTALRHE